MFEMNQGAVLLDEVQICKCSCISCATWSISGVILLGRCPLRVVSKSSVLGGLQNCGSIPDSPIARQPGRDGSFLQSSVARLVSCLALRPNANSVNLTASTRQPSCVSLQLGGGKLDAVLGCERELTERLLFSLLRGSPAVACSVRQFVPRLPTLEVC